ncbi:hypothetical protein B0H13DRAFT_2007136 [Mycena leptocephala]|nr:hypothetical protein B0H13DRAFT_2009152 [Mycena leptocephala]KAJ7912537.1 hypothetical protein B0H13DRAFT_2007136 [Mycena leptocephala]
MSESTVVAMPQPAYANDKPLSLAGIPYPPGSNQDPTGAKPIELIAREISRTPSPTPSELDVLNGVRTKRSWATRIRIYIVLAVVITVIALIEAYHIQIVNALTPVTRWLHDATAGWLIPIVVLIALSFPPLFGHEIVAMLCGLVWGLGGGFGIVAAGTLLGEICTYVFFKYCCGARGKRLELSNMAYGTLAHIVREGGLPIAMIVRYSALPAHLTTAVFATCGMPFWVFLVAAVVSLPKQIVLVYIGVALGNNDSKSDKIQKIVLAVTIVITVIAMVYIRRMMDKAKTAVVYARRKARQAKLQGTPEV